MEKSLPETIEVTIKSLDKKELKFKFNKATTVAEIKERISSDFSLNKDKMRLIYRARKLQDSMKLEDFCTKPNETIFIVAKFANNSNNNRSSNTTNTPNPTSNSNTNTSNTNPGNNRTPPPFQNIFSGFQSGPGGMGNMINQMLGSLQNIQTPGQGSNNSNAQGMPPNLQNIVNSIFAPPSNSQSGNNPPPSLFTSVFSNMQNRNVNQPSPDPFPTTEPTPAPAPNVTSGTPPPPPQPQPRVQQTRNVVIVNSNQNLNHVQSIDRNSINLNISSGNRFSSERGQRVRLPTEQLRNITHLSETNARIWEHHHRSRRNACTLTADYFRTLNEEMRNIQREIEWAAIAFENEGRESDVNYRRIQTQRVQNLGEMMSNMRNVFNDLLWLKKFDFGEEPEKFFINQNDDSANNQGGSSGNDGPNDSQPPPDNRDDDNDDDDDFAIEREDPVESRTNRNTQTNQEEVRDVPPPTEPTRENTEENEVEKERKIVGKFKEILGRGVPVDLPFNKISDMVTEELKQENGNNEEQVISEDTDFVSFMFSEVTPAHTFSLLRGNISFFDEIWPKIKKKYQDLVLEEESDEDILCEKLLSSLNSKMVEPLIDDPLIKEGFDLHEIYLELDGEFFPRFHKLFLGEYQLLVKDSNNDFMQNIMGGIGGAGINLPPQIQNMFGGATSQNQQPRYENEHLPKFSEEFDKLLIEYWGKLVYKYSKGFVGGFEALNNYLKTIFDNFLREFAERHGMSNLPMNMASLYGLTLEHRIKAGYELEENKHKSKLEIMRMLEKIENQTVKTTSEVAQKELSTEYRKGDLMKG
jgi:hypothetical protein